MEDFFSRKWSAGDYLRFVTPSVLSMLSISLYMIVDALFIARCAGPLAMASVNIIMPYFSFTFGIGVMFASGASAILGIELGEKQTDKAHSHFTLTTIFLVMLTATVITATKLIGTDRIAAALGATDALMPYCTAYLDVFLFGIGAVILQVSVEYFIRLDGSPVWAFYTTIAAGLVNVIMDYILIVQMDMDIQGAGIASSLGVVTAVSLGTYYLFFKARTLRFTRPVMDFRFLGNAMINGSSEMVSEISAGVKTLAFNYVIISYAGEYGVAALSILLYMYFLLSSIHLGISVGISPVISFNFGSRNFTKIRELVTSSCIVVLGASILSFLIALIFGGDIIALFAKGEQTVIDIAEGGLTIFAFAYLLEGVSILSSGFFTSVNNGKVSALISFLKSFVFTLGFLFLLPPIFGLNGVWLSVPLSELAAVGLSLYCFMKLRHRYVAPRAIPAT